VIGDYPSRCEDDQAPRPKAVGEPGGRDGRGGNLVQRQNLIDSKAGSAELAFQFAKAVKVDPHAGHPTIGHLAVTQLASVKQCPPGLGS